jgi:hypothetical protein
MVVLFGKINLLKNNEGGKKMDKWQGMENACPVRRAQANKK